MSIFDRHTPEQIATLVKRAEPSGASKGEHDRALDYLAGRMVPHVKDELARRYASTQKVKAGDEMMPQTLPLVERFAAEAANAYDKGVKRRVVGEDGEESEATERVTYALNNLADEMDLDESLYTLDQIQSVVEACGGWVAMKRGRPTLRMAYAHQAHLVRSEEPGFDAASQRDYEAFVIELGSSGSTKSQYAWVARGETAYYEAHSATSAREIDVHANPWTWPQVRDDAAETARPAIQSLPIMPLIWWHRRPPMRQILPDVDSTVASIGHELNLAWSALMDIFRLQSFATLVLQEMQDRGAFRLWGMRFPLKMTPGESAQYLSANVNYDGLVNMLISYQRVAALALRMNPNDFSIQQQAAMSGFAKLVDSLPKLEARNSRVRRLRRTEADYLWPVLCSLMIWRGDVGQEAQKMRLVTDFPDVEFPESPDEIAKRLETDIKYNLDTPAHVLARRKGISLEDAKSAIAENAEINRELKSSTPGEQAQSPGQPPAQAPSGGLPRLGDLIRKSGAKKQEAKDGDDGSAA